MQHLLLQLVLYVLFKVPHVHTSWSASDHASYMGNCSNYFCVSPTYCTHLNTSTSDFITTLAGIMRASIVCEALCSLHWVETSTLLYILYIMVLYYSTMSCIYYCTNYVHIIISTISALYCNAPLHCGCQKVITTPQRETKSYKIDLLAALRTDLLWTCVQCMRSTHVQSLLCVHVG